MKKALSRLGWYFDRIFGDNKRFWWQIAIILGLVLFLVLFIAGVGWLVSKAGLYTRLGKDSTLIQAIGLAFGASNLPPGESQHFPLWWQTIAFLFGAVLFSGVTITFVGNWLGNRQEAYHNGTVRYWFNDHLLFLGGSRIILPMLEMVADDPELNHLHVVVLTTDEVESVRTDINRTLPRETFKRMKITVLSGDHFDKDALASVYAGNARKIYIVGDYLSGSEHDSENVACWEVTKELCSHRMHVPCILYFSRASSVHLFHRRDGSLGDCLDTTVINYLESVAQRVFVHNGTEKNEYPALDRNGIGPKSKRTVHLVVTGTTSASFAMATAAAHLCHFPNSVNPQTLELDPTRRTKITFISPNIKEEMSFITSHLYSLFKMSHYTYVKDTFEDPHKPDDAYGDFLDIEWEFLDGHTADNWVKERLKRYYHDCVDEGKTYLTMAFCEKEADRNIAAAVYLPSEFHRIIYKEDKVTVDYEKTIPLLVFQPKHEEMIHNAHKESPFYRNVFSFGSTRESYDPSIRQRIKEGKRINHIYNKGLDYQHMTTDQEELDQEWREKSYLEQVSNIYCANHIGVKLRSMGIDEEALHQRNKIPEKYMDVMAAVEHNRWNIEKLLMGYEAMEQKRRLEIKHYESIGDHKVPKDVNDKLKKLKKEQYVHYCIATFKELLVGSRDYDYLIVRNLTDVL